MTTYVKANAEEKARVLRAIAAVMGFLGLAAATALGYLSWAVF
ncbi:hypothetical protein [Duganella sp. FT27W]|nr:hypothetical protein [Duganella sp. FT27W]